MSIPSPLPPPTGEVHVAIDYLEGRVQALESTIEELASRLAHALGVGAPPAQAVTGGPSDRPKEITAPAAVRVDSIGGRIHGAIMAVQGLLLRLEI